jgi:hypothetical protein
MALQVPFAGDSFSVGPIMNGDVANAPQIEAGFSLSMGFILGPGLGLGYGGTFSTNGAVGGVQGGVTGFSFGGTWGACQ